MDKVLILMLATAAPAPYRTAPAPPRRPTAVQRYERSPIWDHNPVRVARFGGNLDVQLAAQKFGAERHKAYADQMAKFRVPIVGQVQMQTSVSRSFSTNVR